MWGKDRDLTKRIKFAEKQLRALDSKLSREPEFVTTIAAALAFLLEELKRQGVVDFGLGNLNGQVLWGLGSYAKTASFKHAEDNAFSLEVVAKNDQRSELPLKQAGLFLAAYFKLVAKQAPHTLAFHSSTAYKRADDLMKTIAYKIDALVEPHLSLMEKNHAH